MQKEEFLNKLFSISPDLFPSEFPTGLKEFVLSTIFIVGSIAMRNVITGGNEREKMSTEKIKIDISECEYYSNHGRSYYIVKCPYCGQSNTCYVWSVSANGKRCEGCKSLITLKVGEFTVTKYEKAVISASSRKGVGKSTVDSMLRAEKDGLKTIYNETKLSNDHLKKH